LVIIQIAENPAAADGDQLRRLGSPSVNPLMDTGAMSHDGFPAGPLVHEGPHQRLSITVHIDTMHFQPEACDMHHVDTDNAQR
jgi:hypothetical protein